MLFIVISIITLIAITLVGGLLPSRIGSMSKQGQRWLILGNIFAGGIFLGGGLMHLLPESIENLEGLVEGIEFPFAFLIAAIGFLLILFIEEVALKGEEDVGEMSEGRVAYPFMLTFILSVHSVIAGMALGLNAGLLTGVTIFIAIIAHKGFETFALGVSLHNTNFSYRRQVAVIAFFSCMTPLGIILGAIFSNYLRDSSSQTFEGGFNALAAGTFIYVAIVEIINESFGEGNDRLAKFGSILLGFGMMAILALWV